MIYTMDSTSELSAYSQNVIKQNVNSKEKNRSFNNWEEIFFFYNESLITADEKLMCTRVCFT